jgi:hypothetical protein
MKVIVSGSRDFNDLSLMFGVLDNLEVDTIITGGLQGAEKLSSVYAIMNGCNLERFDLQPFKYYDKCVNKRNREMIDIADYLVVFTNGDPVSADFIEQAKKKLLPTIVRKFKYQIVMTDNDYFSTTYNEL